MKFGKYSLLFLLFASCSSDDGFELPPLGIGGSGVRAMEGGKKVSEVYQEAYSWLHKLTMQVTKSLKGTASKQRASYYGASKGLSKIIGKLETMHACLYEEEQQLLLAEYIAKYQNMRAAVQAMRSSSGLSRKIELWKEEIQSKFKPSTVLLKSIDDVDETAKEEEKDPEKIEDKEPEKKDEKPAPTATDVSPWIYYKSWEKVHSDLVTAYQNGDETGTHYDRLIKLLGHVAAVAKEKENRDRMLYCREGYQQAHEKTKGFTFLPDGRTKRDIIAELEVPAGVIRRNFNPDK